MGQYRKGANIRILLSWGMFFYAFFFLYITSSFLPLYQQIIIIIITLITLWLGIDAILFKYDKINHFTIVILYRYYRLKKKQRKNHNSNP